MKNKEVLDIYSDYLISACGQTTGTGLAGLPGNSVRHDRIQRLLAQERCHATMSSPSQLGPNPKDCQRWTDVMLNSPTGIVTFLFSDVEGSTRLWEQYPEVMPDVMARHAALIETSV